MNIMQRFHAALLLAALCAAGCKDQLPTQPTGNTGGAIFYTTWDASLPPAQMRREVYRVNADGTDRHSVAVGVMHAKPAGGVLLYNLVTPGISTYPLIAADLEGRGIIGLTLGLNVISPTLSPDGRRAAFTVDDSLLYVVNSDGTGLRMIANNALHETSLAISPDGHWVAYYAAGETNDRVCIANIDSAYSRVIAINGSSENDFRGGISWMPDGLGLLYLGKSGAGNRDIYIADILTDTASNLTNDAAEEFTPSLSPDGTKVLYSVYDSFGGSGLTGSDIWIVGTSGAGKRRLTQTTDPGQWEQRPTWSPDGENILYISATEPIEDAVTGTLFKQSLLTGRKDEMARNVRVAYWVRP